MKKKKIKLTKEVKPIIPEIGSRSASHLPLLVRIVNASEGDIAEVGTGYFSTLILKWMAHIYQRNLYSFENHKYWYDKAAREATKYHTVIKIEDWDELPVEKSPSGGRWGLVFIDHMPSQRRKVEIERFANSADFIVIHDTEPDSDKLYKYSDIWKLFKHVYHFKKIYPFTSVVSNFKKLDFLESL